MSLKPLPLVAGVHYETADLERFEYRGTKLTGGNALLRLHMKNGTKVDLRASDEQLRQLAMVMTQAFGPDVIKLLQDLKWV